MDLKSFQCKGKKQDIDSSSSEFQSLVASETEFNPNGIVYPDNVSLSNLAYL